MTSDEHGPTPAEVLRSTRAPDDAGAETADRYEWQAMMATADALSVYFRALDEDGNLVEDFELTFICEHHEDWAIVIGESAEIISGKHREASVGAFSTFRQILGDGGVLHLFRRWCALGGGPTCRLVTTGGLADDAAKLAAACDRLHDNRESQDTVVTEVVTSVTQVIVALETTKHHTPNAEPAEKIRAFLASLRFHDGEPRRVHVPDMAARRYGLPIASRMGRADAAEAIWEAVLGLIRQRMRAAGPALGGALPTVLGAPHDDALAPRTLTLADLHQVIQIAIANPEGFARLPRLIMASKMAVKMAHGGCSDNAIERADGLRLQYRKYWRVLRSNPSTSDHQRKLNNTLLRVIDEATDAVRAAGNLWGAELWREMDSRFRAIGGAAEAHGLDADLLLGGASELANGCRIWYSDRFDVEAALQQLKESIAQ